MGSEYMLSFKEGISVEIGFADDIDDSNGYSLYVYIDINKDIDVDKIFNREILYINQCYDSDEIELSKENPMSNLLM